MMTDKKRKFLLVLLVTGSVLAISFTFYFYQVFYSPNTLLETEQSFVLKIPSNSSYSQVSKNLYDEKVINDAVSFGFVSKVLGYQESVKSGLYIIEPKMTNLELVRKLRSGDQAPIKLTFNNIRTKEDLAEKISKNLEMDEGKFLDLLQDSVYIRKFNFEEETIMGMFIPNTYEVWWDSSPEEIFERMNKEYNRFWNQERRDKARLLGLEPKEVTTLASIVQAESQQKADERPKIAGLYLNRLDRGMYLQADPTLVFALGDFEIKRVLNVHKQIDSPYNTYKNLGLPPGPINLPDIKSLEAVLNPEKHSYLYMCAKADFSGYHEFATNLSAHNANARKYQAALNIAKIYK